MSRTSELKKYLRLEHYPTIWCSGCGNGQVVAALLRSIDSLGLDPDQTVVVSGIGCAARASGYLNFNTLHATHGRALAYATGIKLARPKLHVLVLSGDGDITAIGGNHLIHTARRNIDITLVIINNGIYGMTGGQFSPMTGHSCKATTAPYGNLDHPFDICEVAKAAGATFVARGITYAPVRMEEMITDGLGHSGFSVLEMVSQCPTYYGRFNKFSSPAQMLKWQREHAVSVEKAKSLPSHVLEDKIITGIFVKKMQPHYTELYSRLTESCREDEASK